MQTVQELKKNLLEFDRAIIEDLDIFFEQQTEAFEPALLQIVAFKEMMLIGVPLSSIPWRETIEHLKSLIQAPKFALPDSFDDFRKFLEHPICFQFFRKFLISELSDENLRFWTDVERYRLITVVALEKMNIASQIYDTFIKPGAKNEINISHNNKLKIQEKFQTTPVHAIVEEDVKQNTNIFEAAAKEILGLMQSDSFDRFRKSDLWARLKFKLSQRAFLDIGEVQTYKRNLTEAVSTPSTPVDTSRLRSDYIQKRPQSFGTYSKGNGKHTSLPLSVSSEQPEGSRRSLMSWISNLTTPPSSIRVSPSAKKASNGVGRTQSLQESFEKTSSPKPSLGLAEKLFFPESPNSQNSSRSDMFSPDKLEKPEDFGVPESPKSARSLSEGNSVRRPSVNTARSLDDSDENKEDRQGLDRVSSSTSITLSPSSSKNKKAMEDLQEVTLKRKPSFVEGRGSFRAKQALVFSRSLEDLKELVQSASEIKADMEDPPQETPSSKQPKKQVESSKGDDTDTPRGKKNKKDKKNKKTRKSKTSKSDKKGKNNSPRETMSEMPSGFLSDSAVVAPRTASKRHLKVVASTDSPVTMTNPIPKSSSIDSDNQSSTAEREPKVKFPKEEGATTPRDHEKENQSKNDPPRVTSPNRATSPLNRAQSFFQPKGLKLAVKGLTREKPSEPVKTVVNPLLAEMERTKSQVNLNPTNNDGRKLSTSSSANSALKSTTTNTKPEHAPPLTNNTKKGSSFMIFSNLFSRSEPKLVSTSVNKTINPLFGSKVEEKRRKSTSNRNPKFNKSSEGSEIFSEPESTSKSTVVSTPRDYKSDTENKPSPSDSADYIEQKKVILEQEIEFLEITKKRLHERNEKMKKIAFELQQEEEQSMKLAEERRKQSELIKKKLDEDTENRLKELELLKQRRLQRNASVPSHLQAKMQQQQQLQQGAPSQQQV